MIQRPNDLVAIPPLWRTVIYYVLALTNVVVGALAIDGRVEPLYLSIVAGVSGVFFGVAGSNVVSKGPNVDAGFELEPLPSETQRTGYGSGV